MAVGHVTIMRNLTGTLGNFLEASRSFIETLGYVLEVLLKLLAMFK